jgi:spermidine synthase
MKRSSGLPLLYALVLASGTAGLVYEIVWMRMLIRVFGITLYAVSTVVSVFLGGLALGSWLAGRMARTRSFSLRAYGWIEIGIGVLALFATLAIARLPLLYAGIAPLDVAAPGSLLFVTALRVGLCALVLLGPTMLMGTTLPFLTHGVGGDDVGARTASLYGFNTLGAVVGVLLSGFVLLATIGETGTVLLAVAINVAAGLAFLRGWGPLPSGEKGNVSPSGKGKTSPIVLLLGAAAVTGFCALSFEILWTRFLILILGTSVYAFSTVLALYLTGIGLGSLIASRWVDRAQRPLLRFGWLQVGLALLVVSSLHAFRLVGLRSTDPKFLYSPLLRAGDVAGFFWMGALVIVPSMLVSGMCFPLLARLVAARAGSAGPAIGSVYAWNTVGGILGSTLSAYVLVSRLGAQGSFVLTSATTLLLGCAAILAAAGRRGAAPALGAALAFLALLLPLRGDVYRDVLVRRLERDGGGRLLFHREDASATLTGWQTARGDRNLLINGIQTSGKGLVGQSMAHLPLLLHPDPKRALVICFGAGNTFRAAVDHVGRVDVVELHRGVVESFPAFYDDARAYLERDGVRVFVNDGRNFVLTSRDAYDAIVIDASPPIFSEGTVNLYSREFLELCRRRLTAGGILCLWIPVPCFESDFWRIARGFTRTFPHTFAWTYPGCPGVYLMASAQPFARDRATIAARLRERRLTEIAPWIPAEVFELPWKLEDDEIRRYAERFDAVTDDRPTTEFPLGRFLRGEAFHQEADFLSRAALRRP